MPTPSNLSIMSELQEATQSSRISMIEMAVIVQCTLPTAGTSSVVKKVLSFRAKRDKSANKNHFDRDEYTKAHNLYERKEGTFKDYADANFRYLKARLRIFNLNFNCLLLKWSQWRYWLHNIHWLGSFYLFELFDFCINFINVFFIFKTITK